MKKLALFAMLLGSSFLFGCEKPAEKTPPATPAAGAAGEEKKGDAKTDEAPKADGEKKTDEAAK